MNIRANVGEDSILPPYNVGCLRDVEGAVPYYRVPIKTLCVGRGLAPAEKSELAQRPGGSKPPPYEKATCFLRLAKY